MGEHQHRYVFLRQEEKNIGYPRNPEWEIYDVFFCEECLTYKRVAIRREQPNIESFGRHVTWRA